jgi:hypothetical protein
VRLHEGVIKMNMQAGKCSLLVDFEQVNSSQWYQHLEKVWNPRGRGLAPALEEEDSVPWAVTHPSTRSLPAESPSAAVLARTKAPPRQRSRTGQRIPLLHQVLEWAVRLPIQPISGWWSVGLTKLGPRSSPFQQQTHRQLGVIFLF